VAGHECAGVCVWGGPGQGTGRAWPGCEAAASCTSRRPRLIAANIGAPLTVMFVLLVAPISPSLVALQRSECWSCCCQQHAVSESPCCHLLSMSQPAVTCWAGPPTGRQCPVRAAAWQHCPEVWTWAAALQEHLMLYAVIKGACGGRRQRWLARLLRRCVPGGLSP